MRLKITFLPLFLFLFFNTTAQIDADALMGVPTATTAERVAITGVSLGSIVYDTDVNRIFQYTNTGWQEFLVTGNVFIGAFQISAAGTVTVSGVSW